MTINFSGLPGLLRLPGFPKTAALFAIMVLWSIQAYGTEMWFGTAPFCGGSCPHGWAQTATSKCCGSNKPAGCGSCCWTGSKVRCRAPGANACTQVRTKCYGFVLVCQNGHHDVLQGGAWVTCSSNVCGACFFSALDVDDEKAIAFRIPYRLDDLTGDEAETCAPNDEAAARQNGTHMDASP